MTKAVEGAANDLLGFSYRIEPATAGDARTLLLLHGTGGDENDLIDLGRMLAPSAALLSPRGRVLEGGASRFFRRLAEGIFDLEDLRLRTAELASFVERAAEGHSLDPSRIIAVGFSNGANIAASLLLTRPSLLRGAVLFRAMVPFEPAELVRSSARVLLSEGRSDPLVPRANAERLAELLRATGAMLTLEWQQAGHQLTQADAESARRWLELDHE